MKARVFRFLSVSATIAERSILVAIVKKILRVYIFLLITDKKYL